MSFHKCPKCCGKSVADAGIYCSYCNINLNAGAELYGNSYCKQPEKAAPNETHLASTSRIHMVPNNVPLDFSITKKNRERNYQDTNKTVQELVAKTQRSQEISKKTGKNSYLIQEKSAVTDCTPLGNSQPLDLRIPFLKNESHWNISQFQGPQKDNGTVYEAFLNNDCQWNSRDSMGSSAHSKDDNFSPIVEDLRGFKTLGTSKNHSHQYSKDMVSSDPSHNQKSSASYTKSPNDSNQDDKIFKSEIFIKKGKDVSAASFKDFIYDKTLKLNDTSKVAFHNGSAVDIDGKRIESQYDFAEITRNENESCRISDVAASNSVCYWDENFGASGSSACHGDENTSNVVGKMLQSSDLGDIRSTKYEEIKSLLCRICEDEISQHETEKNVLISIDSLYNNQNGSKLLFHRSTHVPKTTCITCGKEHAVENSHKSEHRCPDPECKKAFPCRTLFYQHIPEHGKYFKKHCWVCGRKFGEHKTDKDSIYICCVCGYQQKVQSSLESHSRLHLPRIFCNLCKEEYHVDEKSFHSNEDECSFCDDKFKCRIQFEKHFEDHVKFLSDLHSVKENNEKLPFIRWTFEGASKVLSEFDYKNRLYSLAGLNVFKCERCGRRFSQNIGGHSRSCKALPYRCEICETRFLTIDLLHSHGLAKHAG